MLQRKLFDGSTASRLLLRKRKLAPMLQLALGCNYEPDPASIASISGKLSDRLVVNCKSCSRPFQRPLSDLLRATGCSKCQNVQPLRLKSVPQQKDFLLQMAHLLFGGQQYDYTNVLERYERPSTRGMIKCNKCGTERITSLEGHVFRSSLVVAIQLQSHPSCRCRAVPDLLPSVTGLPTDSRFNAC